MLTKQSSSSSSSSPSWLSSIIDHDFVGDADKAIIIIIIITVTVMIVIYHRSWLCRWCWQSYARWVERNAPSTGQASAVHVTSKCFFVCILNLVFGFVFYREKCNFPFRYFVVDPLAEYNMPQYILREFKVGRMIMMMIMMMMIMMMIMVMIIITKCPIHIQRVQGM